MTQRVSHLRDGVRQAACAAAAPPALPDPVRARVARSPPPAARQADSIPHALTTSHFGRRILTWSLVVALGPMTLLAVQGYHCATEAILDATMQRLTQLAAAGQKRLEVWVTERLSDAVFLASCPHVRAECESMDVLQGANGGDEAEGTARMAAFLGTFAEKSSIYERIALFDTSWREIAAAGPSSARDPAPPEIRQALQASRAPAIGKPHRGQSQRLTMCFGAPVTSRSGETMAFLVTTLDVARVLELVLVDAEASEEMPRSYLVAMDGSVLTQPGRHDAGAALPQRIDTQGVRLAAAQSHGAALYRDSRDVAVVGGFARLSRWDWIVLVEQSAFEGLAWLRTLAWRAVLVAVLVAGCVAVLSWRTAGRMARPLQELATVALRVADGDHDARVPRSRQPETRAIGEALNHMLDELQEARQRIVQTATLATVGELSSAVVHEMRNPLSSIKMNVRALAGRLGDDAKHLELARIAEEQVGRLERMLSDLLALGKPLAMSLRLASLREAVALATKVVAEEARRRQCSIRFADATGGARVVMDPERMSQALVNLLQNALQAVGAHGEITLTSFLDERDAKRVVLEVRDDGPGIPEDNVDRLFQPFFTTKPDGTGLGLAIVRKIVEYQGGRISARNLRTAPGEATGAVFRIELSRAHGNGSRNHEQHPGRR